MRDRIISQNISDALIYEASFILRMPSNGWGCVDAKELATAILNAAMQDPNIRAAFVAEAIERGEASPPCWDAFSEVCVPNQMVHKTQEHCDKIVSELNQFYEETGSNIRRRTRHWKGQDNPTP